jgi:uncharacterized protein YrzB (UPF0473 family)
VRNYFAGMGGRTENRPNRSDDRAGDGEEVEVSAANHMDDESRRPHLQLLPLHTPSKWPVISETSNLDADRSQH